MNLKHRLCQVEGCGKKHRANGYCARHESQMKIRGHIFGNPSRSKKGGNEFIVDGDEARMMIYNNAGDITAECIIDAEDVVRCKRHGWSMAGYASSKINGRFVSFHRFLLGITDHDINVDHIDRNRLNNRKVNFRLCEKPQNTLNVGVRADNRSGYKGVYWHERNQKWESHIDINRKRVYLGVFQSASEAALAYNEAAKKYHGEFAYLNNIGVQYETTS